MRDKKLEKMVRQEVVQTLREVFSDPESNMSLCTPAATRLKKSIKSKEKGRIIDVKDILRKYKI